MAWLAALRSVGGMSDAMTSRSAAQADCQVLIVGAGPTGLMLAAQLLARGVATRIIDKGDGVILQSRAINVHACTLEILDQMGLAERFIDRGQAVRRLRFYSSGRSLLSLDLALNGSRYGYMLDIPQDCTERLLRARVSELGGEVEQGMELEGLDDKPGRVSAQVRDRAGQASQIMAEYVVGCDGAHSRVRHELGLDFAGHPYPQDWLIADVRLDWDRREDEIHAFFRPDPAPLICFPMTGHRWRLVVPFAGQRDRKPPTLAEIQDLVDERAPEQATVSDPTWLANFHTHRRSTSVYRRGRVLLAGDAVHIHSPAGGQGMNIGMTDAHNLGWKLALVAQGRSPEWLLDTYGEEREPVAAGVLGLTHALVRLGTLSHPAKRAVRDAVVPLLSRVPAVQRRAARRYCQTHVAYPVSRLTQPDRYRGGVRPGDRAPDIDVLVGDHRARLHGVLRSGRHVLVTPRADLAGAAAAASALGPQDAVDVVTSDFEAAPGSGGRDGLVFLVRPDGYVAARGRPGDTRAIVSYLRAIRGAGRQPAGVGPARAGEPLHRADGR
jgi:2-polyprenyl-6-methoxyphenol hydroxylase-like FAD-dependent oxidoreductase